MINKILQSGRPKYILGRLKLNNHEKTRTSEAIVSIKGKLGATRSSFIYRGIKLFNKLPRELQNEANMSSFKQSVKNWISYNVSVKP